MWRQCHSDAPDGKKYARYRTSGQLGNTIAKRQLLITGEREIPEFLPVQNFITRQAYLDLTIDRPQGMILDVA